LVGGITIVIIIIIIIIIIINSINRFNRSLFRIFSNCCYAYLCRRRW